MLRIYIAGPVTGRPQNNLPAFEDAAAKLRSFGHRVVVPHGLIEGTDLHPERDYNKIMRMCLREMLECDIVCLLPDWRFSTGARIEENTARMVGMPVHEVGDIDGLKALQP